jgi:putative drug exporter of the RND superfamily
MQTLARWSFRHRRLVLIAWLLAFIALAGAAHQVGSRYEDNLNLPGTQSAAALSLLHSAAPRSGDADNVVFEASRGSIDDKTSRRHIEAVLTSLATLPHVSSIASPYEAGNAHQVSADGHIAFAIVNFDEPGRLVPTAATERVIAVARSAATTDLRVELGGLAVSEVNKPSIGGAGFGVIAAAIVLLLAFGSLTAMALPLLTALVSLGASLGLIGLLSRVIPMATFTTQLATLIGLGVGIDYAMFIVSRYRQSLLAGRSPEDSTVTAVNTSGRAVLFAGITVCIALLGMFALGVSIFYGVAIAASLAVIITMLAALTLQPALLGFFGTRVLGRRLRRRLAAGDTITVPDSRRWTQWAHQLQRRPAGYALLGLVVLGVLSVPFFSLRLGFSDASNDSTTTTTRQSYDLLAKGFGPGFNGPFQLVSRVHGPTDTADFAALVNVLKSQEGVAGVTAPIQLGGPSSRIDVAQLYPTTAPQEDATTSLLTRLRDTVIPDATTQSDLHVSVGGVTAMNADFSDRIAGRLPLFIAVVVGLSFLLLMMVFRSLLIPLIAAAMNLLSVGAAFGVITAVFERGWLASVFGVAHKGPIEAFIPVIVFAILFGLSMDYEVFLVSRMHETWHHTKDNAKAVTTGLIRTGRTITAAAAIMIFIFGSFTLGDDRIVELFGLGLASAVLIDALVVRTLVLPALMLLIGRRNWALPRGLQRALPVLPVEARDQAETVPRTRTLETRAPSAPRR